MTFRILKKDLRRKKSINLILLLFIFLSVTFIAGSLNNFSIIQRGIDNFMEQSGLADFHIMTIEGSLVQDGKKNEEIEKFLQDNAHVTNFITDEQLFLTKKQTKCKDGTHLELNSTVILCRFDVKSQKFFKEDDKELTQMENGTIYLSKKCLEKNDLKKGDELTICTENGFEKTFTIMGDFKDAFLGSDMMGSERMLVSKADYKQLKEESGLPDGKLYSVNCDDLELFETSYHNQSFNVLFGADRKLIKTSYVLETVIAAVILSVSICLIAIALIMLKFTIVFTVNEDYREIGIMKAIGMEDSVIRRLYTVKYFVLALAGALCGFAASIPFSRFLVQQSTEKLVIQYRGSGILFQFAVSIVIAVLVTLSGYHSTRKIKKMTPMDAIRRGNNGERFRKKGLFRLQGSRRNPTTFLAYNDVMSEIRKYLVLAITGMLGVWLVVMPVNTINTLRSDGLLEWFGTQKCDFFLVDEEKISELMLSGERQKYYDYMEEIRQHLKEQEIFTKRAYTEVFFRLKVRKGDKSFQSFSLQGLNTRMEDYFYDEGTAPVYENEIAMTHIVAEKIGAGLGDTVYVYNNGKEEPYLVTALYQSMNNMGEGIRFTEKANLDYQAVAGGFGIQVELEDKQAELLPMIDKVKEVLPEMEVQTVPEFIDHMVGGVSERLDSLKIMILALVVTINILVVVLMQKMFLVREKGEMGMMKAIGFSDAAIIAWQTKRVLLALFVGIAAGTLTGTYFSEFTAGKVFQLMGAARIVFVVNLLEVYVVYPLVLLFAVAIASLFTMQRVRKITVQEVNDMD